MSLKNKDTLVFHLCQLTANIEKTGFPKGFERSFVVQHFGIGTRLNSAGNRVDQYDEKNSTHQHQPLSSETIPADEDDPQKQGAESKRSNFPNRPRPGRLEPGQKENETSGT
jgi:hypothetical protein